MIDSRSFHKDCRRKINRINSNFSKQVSVPDLDEYINEALYTWFRNNSAKVEINSETRGDLRQFENRGVALDFKEKDDKKSIYELPKDFYKLLNQRLKASIDCGKAHLEECKGCIGRDINIRIVQSGEVNDLIEDPYWGPSFEWQETIGDDSESGLHVWHNNKFNIDSVIIDYLREPNEVRTPSLMKEGYYTIGKNKYSKDKPLELSPIRAHEVSDLVALFVARDISDSDEFQTQINKISTKEQSYTN